MKRKREEEEGVTLVEQVGDEGEGLFNRIFPLEMISYILVDSSDDVTIFVARFVCKLWHHAIRPKDYYKNPVPFPFYVSTVAERGNLELLEWAIIKKRVEWRAQGIPTAAASSVHLHILKWMKNVLHASMEMEEGLQISPAMCAAHKGQLGILKWLSDPAGGNLESAKISSNEVTSYAAMQGHLHILKWMVEEKRLTIDVDECVVAAAQGCHRDVIVWLVDVVGCSGTCKSDPRVMSRFAENDDLAMLTWAKQKGFILTPAACEAAAKEGNLETLMWLLDNKCPWDGCTCYWAAANGHMKLLQWAVSNGAPRHQNACLAAVGGGHFDLLIWLREEGFPCDQHTWNEAVKKGRLDMIKWLYQNGCPFNRYATCELASNEGHLHILKWAIKELGFPWNQKECITAAAQWGRLEILRWIFEEEKICKEWDPSYSEAAAMPLRWREAQVMEWIIENNLECSDLAREYYNDWLKKEQQLKGEGKQPKRWQSLLC